MNATVYVTIGILFAFNMANDSYGFWGRHSKSESKDGAASELNPTTVLHMQLSEKQAEHFTELMERRTHLLKHIEVIDELIKEKQREHDLLQTGLQNRFDINPSMQYRYDQSMKVIFEIGAASEKADTEPTALSEENEKIFRELNERDARFFLQLVRGRTIIQKSLDGLRLLQTQKQRQWKRLYKKLFKNFKISPNHNYHYETDTRTLYRMLTPAQM